MASKKEQRRLAIKRERQRRIRAATDACPISRDEYTNLVDHVSDRIVEQGHDQDFSITTEYLESHGHPLRPVLDFLADHRITDDWSVLVSGDPHTLFGETATKRVRMPLDRPELKALIEWLDAEIRSRDCDHTHKMTQFWLLEHDIEPTRTIGALMAIGGFCDCEVALNVEIETVYPDGTANKSSETTADPPRC